ncbi:MAG: hypothetical protein NVSMB31_03240 [Vulcanimicrobiaceae bacterium]
MDRADIVLDGGLVADHQQGHNERQNEHYHGAKAAGKKGQQIAVLALKLMISALCALGLYASVFMARKAARAQAGELTEPSVVQQPAARLFFGIPNAVFGVFYYLGAGLAVWWIGSLLWIPLLLAAAGAALVSLYLAYSLLFVTKMPCPFCWTSHAVNWLLIVQLTLLHKLT